MSIGVTPRTPRMLSPCLCSPIPMTLVDLTGHLGRADEDERRWRLVLEFLEEYSHEGEGRVTLLVDDPPSTATPAGTFFLAHWPSTSPQPTTDRCRRAACQAAASGSVEFGSSILCHRPESGRSLTLPRPFGGEGSSCTRRSSSSMSEHQSVAAGAANGGQHGTRSVDGVPACGVAKRG